MNRKPLLLADPSPCLRWLILRQLFQISGDHPEVMELAALRQQDALAAGILSLQLPDGSWNPGALAEGRVGGSRILMTAFALTRLGYLGFDRTEPAVERAASWLLARQEVDGSWPLASKDASIDGYVDTPPQEKYSMIPLQTSIPLRGLAAVGYAEDERTELAFEWLLAQRLPDGAWPTGIAAGVYGGVGGYRRLAHSRWGCRSNTTSALVCLSLHPRRRTGSEARRALDLLLGQETRDTWALGCEVARMVGAEPAHGFLTYFARFDLALILDLCARVGASREDARVASMVDFVLSRQGEYGLWEYAAQPQISRWLTFDLLRSLSRLDENTDWFSIEPRTPFRAYPKRHRRF